MSRFQGTVTRNIKFAGVGLHSGRLVNLTVSPAPPNTGIMFIRTDLTNAAPITAHPDNICSTLLCTTLGSGENKVSTVEHLMAALYGMGIDNALIHVNNQEIPILDGSSAPFVDKLNEVGVQLQNFRKKIIKINKSITVTSDDQYMTYEPVTSSHEESPLSIHYTISFPQSTIIGKQTLSFNLCKSTFMEICEARTFCHIDEVNSMRKAGLALGGSLDNAVVVDSQKVMNIEGLRYKDEFIRHKILDCLGDLALLGGHISGKITVHKGGHKLHATLVKAIHDEMLLEKNYEAEEYMEQQEDVFEFETKKLNTYR